MSPVESAPNLFTGRWVGKTQGCAMPAHIWEITLQGGMLVLSTRWEGQTRVVHFYASVASDEPALIIDANEPVKAILVDKQHFVIPDWCTNDMRDGKGPSYDVVFSRPGIAELTAGHAYAQYLKAKRGE